MNLSHLKTFIAVVEHNSISRAAAELHLTQPAATKHVQALEDHYGCLLLKRTGRQILPTEEGKILYQHAQEVVRILEAAEAALAGGTRVGREVSPKPFAFTNKNGKDDTGEQPKIHPQPGPCCTGSDG